MCAWHRPQPYNAIIGLSHPYPLTSRDLYNIISQSSGEQFNRSGWNVGKVSRNLCYLMKTPVGCETHLQFFFLLTLLTSDSWCWATELLAIADGAQPVRLGQRAHQGHHLGRPLAWVVARLGGIGEKHPGTYGLEAWGTKGTVETRRPLNQWLPSKVLHDMLCSDQVEQITCFTQQVSCFS